MNPGGGKYGHCMKCELPKKNSFPIMRFIDAWCNRLVGNASRSSIFFLLERSMLLFAAHTIRKVIPSTRAHAQKQRRGIPYTTTFSLSPKHAAWNTTQREEERRNKPTPPLCVCFCLPFLLTCMLGSFSVLRRELGGKKRVVKTDLLFPALYLPPFLLFIRDLLCSTLGNVVGRLQLPLEIRKTQDERMKEWGPGYCVQNPSIFCVFFDIRVCFGIGKERAIVYFF